MVILKGNDMCKKIFCFYCNQNIANTKDHIIPLANSGSNNRNNIVPACRECNSLKGSLMPREFAEYLEKIITLRIQIKHKYVSLPFSYILNQTNWLINVHIPNCGDLLFKKNIKK